MDQIPVILQTLTHLLLLRQGVLAVDVESQLQGLTGAILARGYGRQRCCGLRRPLCRLGLGPGFRLCCTCGRCLKELR